MPRYNINYPRKTVYHVEKVNIIPKIQCPPCPPSKKFVIDNLKIFPEDIVIPLSTFLVASQDMQVELIYGANLWKIENFDLGEGNIQYWFTCHINRTGQPFNIFVPQGAHYLIRAAFGGVYRQGELDGFYFGDDLNDPDQDPTGLFISPNLVDISYE